ncbi:MAG: hypothetical protein KJ017_05595 [Alphaproteobacteria bacterium]|nr:hypothetical protein [Alphaproteobacteria bacterium]
MTQRIAPPQPWPFSIRLTFEERAHLLGAAGDMPLGSYIRKVLLQESASYKRRRVRRPVKDDQALAKLLAELGRSHLANNMNQLAKAVNSGSLPLTQDTEKAIQDACDEIRWMRQTLVAALGLELDTGGGN